MAIVRLIFLSNMENDTKLCRQLLEQPYHDLGENLSLNVNLFITDHFRLDHLKDALESKGKILSEMDCINILKTFSDDEIKLRALKSIVQSEKCHNSISHHNLFINLFTLPEDQMNAKSLLSQIKKFN